MESTSVMYYWIVLRVIQRSLTRPYTVVSSSLPPIFINVITKLKEDRCCVVTVTTLRQQGPDRLNKSLHQTSANFHTWSYLVENWLRSVHPGDRTLGQWCAIPQPVEGPVQRCIQRAWPTLQIALRCFSWGETRRSWANSVRCPNQWRVRSGLTYPHLCWSTHTQTSKLYVLVNSSVFVL
jgi:hypothetical protein